MNKAAIILIVMAVMIMLGSIIFAIIYKDKQTVRCLESLSLDMFKKKYKWEPVRYKGNSMGLLKDCVLILNSWEGLTFPKQFHVESVDRDNYFYEWFFPNLEFINDKKLRKISCRQIACKTKESFKILKDKLPKKRVLYTGFTSEDFYDPKYTKDYNKWLHIAGKSEFKGTDTLLQAWKMHPEWPTLTVLYGKNPCSTKFIKEGGNLPNVRLIDNFADRNTLREIMNTHGVHIYPCIVEGFGHTMNEAKTVKGVTLYTNGGAMAEHFEDGKTGIPIEVVDNSVDMGLLKLQKVSIKTIENSVKRVQSLSHQQLKQIGEYARSSFLRGRKEFKERMTKCAFYCDDHSICQGIPFSYGVGFQHIWRNNESFYNSKVGIVITTFGRPEILDSCLSSIGKSDLKDAVIVIVDESATKLEPIETSKTHRIVGDFKPNANVLKIFKRNHGNMFDSIKSAINHLAQNGIEYFAILDSDTLVSPNWLTKLRDVYNLNMPIPKIITGFNTEQNNHVTIFENDKYYIKSSIGGINMFFDKQTYFDYVLPQLVDKQWDWNVSNAIVGAGGVLVSTKPSVVDHIGVYGLNSSSESYDRAIDLGKMKKLKIDKELAKKFCKRDTDGCSQFEQAGILNQIFDQIGTTNKFFVEFGSRRPNILNSSYFRMHKSWKGVLLDGDPDGNAPNCNGISEGVEELLNNDEIDGAILRKEFITKENVNQIFAKYGIPSSFDLLTVDIDKNEYHIMDGLDTNKFSPRVVCIEFSSYFTKDQDCVPIYKPKAVWDGVSITNSSLAALDRLMKTKGYSYITHASGEHAIFVKNTEIAVDDTIYEIPDVKEGWQYNARKHEQNKKYKPRHFYCQ